MSVLRRNILFLGVSQMATWIATFGLLILAPRRLGPDGFGQVTFVTAYIGFFTLIGSLGSYQHIVKNIARERNVLAALVVSALKLKLLMGVGLSVLAISIGAAVGYDREQLILISIGCVGMVLTLLNEMAVAGLAGLERMARTALWQTIQVYLSVGIAVIVLFTTGSLYGYVAAFSLTWAVPLAANFWALKPLLRGAASRQRAVWRAIIRGGLPIFAITGLSLVYTTMDIPIVEAISGSEVVGWYTLAYRWVGVPIFMTTIVVTAFLPQLSAFAHSAPDKFCTLANRAIKLVLVVTIPASIGIALVSSDLIELFYGAEFEESARLMKLLSPTVPLVALNTVLGTALVASDRHIRYLWVAATAAVVNPIFTVLAVRSAQERLENGAVGSAVVTVITEVFVTAGALLLSQHGVMDRRTRSYVLRCLLAAAAMAPPILLLGGSGLIVKVVVGGVTYLLVSVLFRTVSWSSAIRSLNGIRSGKSLVGSEVTAACDESAHLVGEL